MNPFFATQRPPVLARWLLRLLCSPHHRDAVEGDFDELFSARVQSSGLRVARWRSLLDAFSAVRTRSSPLSAPSASETGAAISSGGAPLLPAFLSDLRHAARVLLAHRAFALVSILTLALGIGVNTAIFSAVYSILLRPLPFRDPEPVVSLARKDTRYADAYNNVAPADFLDWRDRSRSLSEFAVVEPWSYELTGNGEPIYLRASRVSAAFFPLLGIQPLHGRLFLPEEYELGNTSVVLLSHALWQQRFGGDLSIVGRTILLDNQTYLVAGVLPPSARLRLFEKDEELWSPLYFHEALRTQRSGGSWRVLARLRPGIAPAAAQAEMDTIAAQISEENPRTHHGVGVSIIPLRDFLVGRVRPALLVLLGAVVLVLFIACANIANLLLARGNDRHREWAIRAALGAGRARLAAQLLAESLLLATLGCAAGLLLALGVLHLIHIFGPAEIRGLADLRLDLPVLAFAIAVSLLAALSASLVPAMRATTPDLRQPLHSDSAAPPGSPRSRLGAALIAGEVALAVVLLAGAGLLLRSFSQLLRVHPGFSPDRVAALQVFVWGQYPTAAGRIEYFRRAEERLLALPGVEAVGTVSALPFLGASSIAISVPIQIEGQSPAAPGEAPMVHSTIVTAGYFRTLAIPQIRGRGFSDSDTESSPRVALINETLARRFWPGQDPIGRHFTVPARQPVTFEVIGVVGDVLHTGLDAAPRPEFFRPFKQAAFGSMTFVVRTARDPAAALPSMKSALWEVNNQLPFWSATTMDTLVSGTLAERRFVAALVGLFSALALLLAAVGIYGMISYATGRRTQEIGVRIALGAGRREILTLVLRQGMRLPAIGAALGVLAALGMTRLLAKNLFGVRPSDPLSFAAAVLLLGLVALLACYLPARRAARLDPVTALRHE